MKRYLNSIYLDKDDIIPVFRNVRPFDLTFSHFCADSITYDEWKKCHFVLFEDENHNWYDITNNNHGYMFNIMFFTTRPVLYFSYVYYFTI